MAHDDVEVHAGFGAVGGGGFYFDQVAAGFGVGVFDAAVAVGGEFDGVAVAVGDACCAVAEVPAFGDLAGGLRDGLVVHEEATGLEGDGAAGAGVERRIVRGVEADVGGLGGGGVEDADDGGVAGEVALGVADLE